MTLDVIEGDCLAVLPTLGARYHAVVTDPPYHLTSIVKRFGNASMERETFAANNPTTAYKSLSAGFMGKQWDGGDVAFRPETWRAIYDCMYPGAYLVAFASTRGYHRMVCAIEDAGFVIHPMLGWIFGSGFPKATNLSKMIDRQAGAERTEIIGSKLGRPGMAKDGSNQRSGFDDAFGGQASGPMSTDITASATPEAQQWDGWAYGLQSLKPALEPICLAQRPVERGGMVANILRHGCGALNIDASRVGTGDDRTSGGATGKRVSADDGYGGAWADAGEGRERPTGGRWPANVIHDGSDEVEAAFAAFGERTTSAGTFKRKASLGVDSNVNVASRRDEMAGVGFGDTGTASRFFTQCPFSEDELRIFYSGKADAADRADSRHPTVKPVELMKWLVRLVTPPVAYVCEWCDTVSYGNSTKGDSGSSPVRGVPSAVQADRQSGATEVLLEDVRLPGDAQGTNSCDMSAVRQEVSAGETIAHSAPLFAKLRVEVDRCEMGQGLCDRSQGIPAYISSGSSEGEPGWLHHGTPADNGSGAQSAAANYGSSASHQRAEGGQSARKLGGDDQAGARQSAETAAEADQMSPLPRSDRHFGSCQACGGALIRRSPKVLDPFAGSGTTGEAAMLCGVDCTMIERDPQHVADIRHRIRRWSGLDAPLFAEAAD